MSVIKQTSSTSTSLNKNNSHTNMETMTQELGENPNFSFSRAKIGSFFQTKPELHNQYREDVTLQRYLKRHLPEDVFTEVSEDLDRFGHRVATDLFNLAVECERIQPYLRQYDAWGNRVDEIVTSSAWKEMKRVAAVEGLIATAYERKYGPWSRLYQMAKLYLFSASSGLFSCPLAMTDGASRCLEPMLKEPRYAEAYRHLISRDPDTFWTSGQWMTERKGGSDVAEGTETYAIPQLDGSYRLYGYKWFTSATDADMALTLARVLSKNGETVPGTGGLALFYLDVRDDQGNLNNIEIQRLKDKLGTRQMPTAELLLDGTKAYKISQDGRGVAAVSKMLTLTRIHNSLSAASGMRRMTNLTRDYSTKRFAFGKPIKDFPLHIKIIAQIDVRSRAATLLVLEMARLLGLSDCGKSSEHDDHILRLMTPIAKLYTAKQAIQVASEALECFGGQGYMEDTHLPQRFRDTQVLSIWEGTTNVLSLDVLRAIAKSQGQALKAFQEEVTRRTTIGHARPDLKASSEKLRESVKYILKFATEHKDKLEISARDFSYSIARVYMGCLLVDHASWEEAVKEDVLAAQRWCQQELTPIIQEQGMGNYTEEMAQAELSMVMDGYQGNTNSKI